LYWTQSSFIPWILSLYYQFKRLLNLLDAGLDHGQSNSNAQREVPQQQHMQPPQSPGYSETCGPTQGPAQEGIGRNPMNCIHLLGPWILFVLNNDTCKVWIAFPWILYVLNNDTCKVWMDL
jgi:hypothetical protein